MSDIFRMSCTADACGCCQDTLAGAGYTISGEVKTQQASHICSGYEVGLRCRVCWLVGMKWAWWAVAHFWTQQLYIAHAA